MQKGRGLTETDQGLLSGTQAELEALFGDISAAHNGEAGQALQEAAKRLGAIEVLVNTFEQDQLPEGKEGVGLKLAAMERIDVTRKKIEAITGYPPYQAKGSQTIESLAALWQELSTLSSQIVLEHTQGKIKEIERSAAEKSEQVEKLLVQHQQEVEQAKAAQPEPEVAPEPSAETPSSQALEDEMLHLIQEDLAAGELSPSAEVQPAPPSPEEDKASLQKVMEVEAAAPAPKEPESPPSGRAEFKSQTPEQIEQLRERAAEIVLQSGGASVFTSLDKELSPNYSAGFQNLETRTQGKASSAGSRIESQFLSQNERSKGTRIDEALKEHGIREIVYISREQQPVFETVTIPGKKGTLGIGKTPDRTEKRATGRYEPTLHSDIVSNGKKEAAVRFTYYIPQSDWRDYSGRRGQMMAVEIVLPESDARVVEQTLESDPAAIRRIVERVMKERLLKDPKAWETPQGNGDPLRPPYESWDAEPGGGTIYVQTEGMTPGFHPEAAKKAGQPEVEAPVAASEAEATAAPAAPAAAAPEGAPEPAAAVASPEAAPVAPEKTENEEVRGLVEKIRAKRISGEISWSGVDAMLQEKGIEPGTAQAEQFMEDWDRQQAERIAKNEAPDALVALVAEGLREKEPVVADPTEAEAEDKKFIPTSEWQEVPEDTILPPGLEIRMNFTTGKNEARLPEEETTSRATAAPEVPESAPELGVLEAKLAAAREVLKKANQDLAVFLQSAGSSALDEAGWEKERQTLLVARSEALAEFEKTAALFETEAKLNEAKARLTEAEQALASHLENIEVAADPATLAETERLMQAEQEARGKYESLRAELVSNRVQIALEKRMQQSEEQAAQAEKGLIEKVGRKIYEAQRWLGEKNLSKYLGENWQNKDTNTKLTKIFKGTVRLGARLASLRTVTCGAMLGAGAAVGLTTAAGVGIIGARRVLSSIATYYGAHDGMASYRQAKNTEIMKQKLTPDELKGMTEDDLLERLGVFEATARMDRESLREDENYKTLWQELENRMKYNAVDSRLDELLAQAETRTVEAEKRMKTKERNRKLIAGTVAVLAGTSSYWLPTAWQGVKGGWHGVKDMIGSGPSGEEMKFSGALTGEAHGATLEEEGLLPDSRQTFAPAAESTSAPKGPEVLPESPAVEPATAESALKAAPPAEAAPTAADIEYQGGKSIWAEVSRQYAKRFSGWDSLLQAERTYLIDQVKDKFTANPAAFHLEDANKVTAEQLRAIDWDKAFEGVRLVKPKLTEAQIANIDHPAPVEHPAPAAPEPEPLAAETTTGLDTGLEGQQLPELPTEAVEPPPAAEAPAPAEVQPSVEATPENFVAYAFEHNPGESVERLRAFAYSIEADDYREALMKDPERLQRKFEGFQKILTDNTERLRGGRLEKIAMSQPSPVEAQDGHVYFLYSPEGKLGKFNILVQGEDGGYARVFKTGLFGRQKMVFDADGVKRLLGYVGGAKSEAVSAAATEVGAGKVAVAAEAAPGGKVPGPEAAPVRPESSAAEAAFEDLDAGAKTLETFENKSLPFVERLAALKSYIPDKQRINLGAYEFARDGDKVYYMTSSDHGVLLTEESSAGILEAAEKAKAAVLSGQDAPGAEAGPEKAEAAFTDLGKGEAVIKALEDNNAPLADKLKALRDYIGDRQKVTLNGLEFTRVGKDVFYMVEPSRGVPVDEQVLSKILEAHRLAKAAAG